MLAFAVPDSVSAYQQTMYPDFRAYRDEVIVPEMLIKLKQGFGRLIRTEKDTGAVAILDNRVCFGETYRDCVIDALPDCPITDSLEDIKNFMLVNKPAEYFAA